MDPYEVQAQDSGGKKLQNAQQDAEKNARGQTWKSSGKISLVAAFLSNQNGGDSIPLRPWSWHSSALALRAPPGTTLPSGTQFYR